MVEKLEKAEWKFLCNFYAGCAPYTYGPSVTYYKGEPSNSGSIWYLADSKLDSDERLVMFGVNIH